MDHPDLTDEEIREAIEHRDVLLDIRALLGTPSGKNFIKYLFKNLGASEMPEMGLTGEILMDKLGFLRAGNSIFKLVSEANATEAGKLLALIERDRHARLYNERNEDA